MKKLKYRIVSIFIAIIVGTVLISINYFIRNKTGLDLRSLMIFGFIPIGPLVFSSLMLSSYIVKLQEYNLKLNRFDYFFFILLGFLSFMGTDFLGYYLAGRSQGVLIREHISFAEYYLYSYGLYEVEGNSFIMNNDSTYVLNIFSKIIDFLISMGASYFAIITLENEYYCEECEKYFNKFEIDKCKLDILDKYSFSSLEVKDVENLIKEDIITEDKKDRIKLKISYCEDCQQGVLEILKIYYTENDKKKEDNLGTYKLSSEVVFSLQQFNNNNFLSSNNVRAEI